MGHQSIREERSTRPPTNQVVSHWFQSGGQERQCRARRERGVSYLHLIKEVAPQDKSLHLAVGLDILVAVREHLWNAKSGVYRKEAFTAEHGIPNVTTAAYVKCRVEFQRNVQVLHTE